MKKAHALGIAASLLISSTAAPSDPEASGMRFTLDRARYSFELGGGASSAPIPMHGLGVGGNFDARLGSIDNPDIARVHIGASSNQLVSMDFVFGIRASDFSKKAPKYLEFELTPVYGKFTPAQIIRYTSVPAILSSGILGKTGVRFRQNNGSTTTVGILPFGGFIDAVTGAHSPLFMSETSGFAKTEQILPHGVTLSAEVTAGILSWLNTDKKAQDGIGRYLSATVAAKKSLGDSFYIRVEASGDDVAYRLVDRSKNPVSGVREVQDIHRTAISGMLYLGYNGEWKSQHMRDKERFESDMARLHLMNAVDAMRKKQAQNAILSQENVLKVPVVIFQNILPKKSEPIEAVEWAPETVQEEVQTPSQTDKDLEPSDIAN